VFGTRERERHEVGVEEVGEEVQDKRIRGHFRCHNRHFDKEEVEEQMMVG